MNTVELIESTRVSSFQLFHSYANATLFRDTSVKKQHIRLGQNDIFVLHAERKTVWLLPQTELEYHKVGIYKEEMRGYPLKHSDILRSEVRNHFENIHTSKLSHILESY